MSSDKDTLLSMGFDSARVEWALKATNNRGLQPAMDHLIENEGKPIPNLTDVSTISSSDAGAGAGASGGGDEDEDEDAEALKAIYGSGAAGVAAAAADVEAKSIKCSICGKVFRNTAFANFHAEKSGHDQFEESAEEIKPLTEEEKKQKLEELRAKMAEKRAVKAKAQAEEDRKNEVIRRKAGKDMGNVREEMRAKEAIKEAEQRHKDKIEEAKAKAAVRAQIEADKRQRAEKAEREKALRQGLQPPQPQNAAPANPGPSAAAAASNVASKDYKDTRLQIRLATGGQPYMTTLPSDSTLRDVAEYLAAQTLSVNVDTIIFSQQFPRKQFTSADFSKTLRDLGLTPSAVLIASQSV